ncbi:MAG TPA: hypothetical protein VGO58_19570, partial [Chitinophagaceae bacterium]|nr:hypothetical protein [Chitinophagaceae bacterium]
EKIININENSPVSATERASYIEKLQEKLKTHPKDAVLLKKINDAKDTAILLRQIDTYDEDKGVIQFSNKNYKTFAEYDSTENTLSPGERDGWLMRRIVKKQIDINNKYRYNPVDAGRKLAEGFLHRLPYLLFISLPLFALILKLVYIRRKQFYFADHGVFTIHLYVFSFLVLLLVFGFDKLQEVTGSGLWDTAQAFVFLGLGIYLYIAMRNFYKQGWIKTFIKFLLVTILSLIMMLILFTGFLVFSAATI